MNIYDLALPEPSCDFVGIVRPLSNVILSNLLGFAPYAAIVIGTALALALVIVAASRRARDTVARNLASVVVAAIILAIVLGGIGILITSPCGV